MSLPRVQAGSAELDVESVRADFPILAQKINGRPLAYLDNAASAQRPRAVIDAMTRYYSHDHANVHVETGSTQAIPGLDKV